MVGTSADYPPYEFHAEVDGKDTIVGFDMEIAQAIAAPLAKTEKIVIVDNGSTNGEGARGASKVTNYVTDIIGQLPETVEALTGYNLMDVFKKKGQSAQTPAADTVEAAQEAEPAE